MKKRLLALLLCLVMLLAFACSCGDNAEEPTTPSEPSTPDEPATPDEPEDPEEPAVEAVYVDGVLQPFSSEGITLPLVEEPYTFTAWIGDMPFFYAYVDEWMPNNWSMNAMAEMTNVNFEWTYASDPNTSLSIISASGEYPDVFFSAASWYAGGLSRGIEEGVFMALEEYIPEEIPNLWAILQSSDAVRRDMTTYDGHIGTIYSILDQDGGGNPPTVALVRGDWLDALGYTADEIVTYDDYHDYLAAAYAQYGAQLMIPYSGAATNQGLISGYKVAGLFSTTSANYPFYQVDGEVKFGILEPEYKDYIAMMAEWYSEGLIHEDFITFTTPSRPNSDPIVQNEVSMIHWNPANAADVLVQMDEGASLVGVREPVKEGNEDELNVFGNPRYTTFYGFQVSTTCSNLDLLFDWCNFGYTDLGYLAFNYGKEGVTYEMVDGEPTFTDFIMANETGMPFSLAQMLMIQDAGPFVVDALKKFDYYEDYVVEAIHKVTDYTDYDNSYFLPTTLALAAEDATVFSTTMGDIGTYIDEHLTQFIMGIESLDNWDEFIAQINAMGIQDCIDMYQNAYDVYMSH